MQTKVCMDYQKYAKLAGYSSFI